jgi:nucleoside-diphosphate-sugar epimerase
LATALLERGDAVRAFVLPSEDAGWLDERGVKVYHGDICDAKTLDAPLEGVDAVFHLAALQGQWVPMQQYVQVNVDGTANVCRAVLNASVRRLVHVSSWTIYGIARGSELCEDEAPAPQRDPYWISKAHGDLLVQRMIRDEALPAAIIRPGTIFGVGDKLNFARIADKVRSGKAIIIGSGRNALPFVYVTDVVQGLLLCADQPQAEGQVFNITNDEPLTQEELLNAVAADLGVAPPRVHVPYGIALALAIAAEQAVRLTRAAHPVVTVHGVKLYGTDNRHSIDKARRELGYGPLVPIREGARRACEWYKHEYLG